MLILIRHSPLGMPYGFFSCLFFFHRQGFRTITFERQGGTFRNFRRSWVMIKGRGYRFPTQRDPQVGRGAPQNPPLPHFCLRLGTPHFFCLSVGTKKKLCGVFVCQKVWIFVICFSYIITDSFSYFSKVFIKFCCYFGFVSYIFGVNVKWIWKAWFSISFIKCLVQNSLCFERQ